MCLCIYLSIYYSVSPIYVDLPESLYLLLSLAFEFLRLSEQSHRCSI